MTTTITIPAHKVAAVEAALFRAGRKTFTVGQYSDGWHATPNNTNHHMKHNRLKIVITAKNQTQYFLGDGFWFGRISKAKFEAKLAAGCTIFKTVSHLPENVVCFA